MVMSEDQSKESLASLIVDSLGDLSDAELPEVRKQLQNDFLPDDICLLGAQFVDLPGQTPSYGLKDLKSEKEVVRVSFSVEVDNVAESFENLSDPKLQFPDNTNLLSVNQLMESVLETARQVGRMSVSTTPDVPFKEMTSHCEALSLGKQQKMSFFVSTQQRQEFFVSGITQDQEIVKSTSCFQANTVQMGNGFFEQQLIANVQFPSKPSPLMCATEFQAQPHFYKLPASSPYDDFLRAAGC